jgi:hypothetical protein
MRFHPALSESLRCQRGIALPMAMLTLLVLSALIIAFSMMAGSEPLLANNQLQVAQARAVAESGIERAIWALNNNTDANGIPNNYDGSPTPMGGATAPAPYDGSVAIPVLTNGAQVGVFRVVVRQGDTLNERVITATGWYPTDAGTGPKVKQKIQVTVVKFLGNPPPAPLTVRGEIQAGGTAEIDARSDTSCGPKVGAISADSTEVGGTAKIYGAGDNQYYNPTTNPDVHDVVQNVGGPALDQYMYSFAQLNALKALAKQNGTYYQPTTSGSPSSPNVSFSSSNKLRNGVIYIDTISGQNIDQGGQGTTPDTDVAYAQISGNSEPVPGDGYFHGVIVVAGSLYIDGDFHMDGLIYTVNDFNYRGTGTGQLQGAVLSRNIRDTSSTSIDTNTTGQSKIVWNCYYATYGGGWVPPTFIPERGTYKEIPG